MRKRYIGGNALVEMGLDAYRGDSTQNYSKDQINEKFRLQLAKLIGFTDETFNDKKKYYYAYQQNKYKLFQIISEIVDEIIPETVEEQFDQFAEVKSYDLGDKPVFEDFEDPARFNISVISEANNDLIAQRVWKGRSLQTVSTEWKGAKIHTELLDVLLGRTDWASMVENIRASYESHIRLDVYNKFVATYPTISAPYSVTGSVTVNALSELIAHVEAATGRGAVIVGTKTALGKVPVEHLTEKAKESKNTIGYYGSFQQTPMKVLRQGYKEFTTDWALDNNKLIVLPDAEVKPVKVLLEGDTIIMEKGPENFLDERIEYMFKKKTGVAVLQTIKYGVYNIV